MQLPCPGKSAHNALDAVSVGIERRKVGWILDADISKFYDSMDHTLLLRAVHKHTDCKWLRLYIERWLKAPAQLEDGTLIPRDRGAPQGGVISPLVSNLFLHYAFDRWMRQTYPAVPFERYADDAVVHCRTEAEAQRLMQAMAQRLAECGLELHPEKTKIVYCKDGQRKLNYPLVKFDFLGFSFQPRQAKNRWGGLFLNFSPAVSAKAAKSIRHTIRSWKLHRWTQLTIEEIAASFNPVLRGWINYYGSYYRSLLAPILGVLSQ
jgi:RNA-directed DNA polymerase